MLFFFFLVFLCQFSREILFATIAKLRVYEMLHEIVGTIEQFIVIGNHTDKPFQLVKLCILFDSKDGFEGLGAKIRNFSPFTKSLCPILDY